MTQTMKSIPVPQSEVSPAEGPVFMIDSRGNLIIETNTLRLMFTPSDALELFKFLERTGYQAHANSISKRVAP